MAKNLILSQECPGFYPTSKFLLSPKVEKLSFFLPNIKVLFEYLSVTFTSLEKLFIHVLIFGFNKFIILLVESSIFGLLFSIFSFLSLISTALNSTVLFIWGTIFCRFFIISFPFIKPCLRFRSLYSISYLCLCKS